jgi:hypothetical protein
VTDVGVEHGTNMGPFAASVSPDSDILATATT